MAKKIYDILPPKLAHKVEDTIKELAIGEKNKKSRHKPNKRKHKERRLPLKEVLIGGSIIIILLVIYFYNTLPKADIQIGPKMEPLKLQEKIVADRYAADVDLYKKVIPAQYVEVQQDGLQEFPATGSASNDGKASGTIKIYNKISPSTSFVLKVGTHFLSDSGKYFVTLEKITIPASQKNAPGSIIVKVKAEESGPSYNIGPSKFSIPKLSGTSYYYNVWGESSNAMIGGYTGKVKKVTKDDIELAKEVLTKKLFSQAEDLLKNKLSKDDILLEGAVFKNIVSAGSDVKEGTVVDKFNEQAKVKVSALVFKKQDLEKFAKNYIFLQISNDKTFLEKSLAATYTTETVDMKEGSATINVALSVNIYYELETNDLVDLLVGKSEDQIKEIVDSRYNDRIISTTVNFWPFWVKSVPKNKDRIKINLNFE